MNCWEYKKCGREPGGINTETLGECPAAVAEKFNGVHGGTNAGRACWVVAGSYCCGNNCRGSFVQHVRCCLDCDFYKSVRMEEMPKGTFFMTPSLLIMGLRELNQPNKATNEEAQRQRTNRDARQQR